MSDMMQIYSTVYGLDPIFYRIFTLILFILILSCHCSVCLVLNFFNFITNTVCL